MNESSELLELTNEFEETTFPLPRIHHTTNYWLKNESLILLGGKMKNESFCRNKIWFSSANGYEHEWQELEISTNSKDTPYLYQHSSIIFNIPNVSDVLFTFGGIIPSNQVINIAYMFNLSNNFFFFSFFMTKIFFIDWKMKRRYKKKFFFCYSIFVDVFSSIHHPNYIPP